MENVLRDVTRYLGYDPYGPDNPNRGGSRWASWLKVSNALIALGISGGIYRSIKNNFLRSNKAMPYTKRTTRKRSRRSTKKKQYKRTVTRKRRGRPSVRPKASSLRKEVKLIKRQLNADSAKHVYKAMYASTYSCAVNQCSYNESPIVTGPLIETFMANLRYYDPSAPGTLVTANASTGTYQREIHFKNIHGSIEISNNYQVPCKVRVYLLKPKGDTAITPSTYYNNSITDQLIGGGSTTTKGVFPTDLNAFMAQWSCSCVKDVVLDAGARIVATHNTGGFKYDPSLFDSHSLDYQTKFKACAWFVRLEGVFGHDTSANQQTTLAGQVDVNVQIKADIMYDAGINLDDLYVLNSHAAAFTNAGVVSNKPIADNQSLSVA